MPDRDELYNRCAWRDGPNRCAYVARVFPNITEQRKDASPERGLCIGHHYHGGAAVLERSLKDVPLDFDYSTAALVKMSLESYEAGAVQREPGQEG